MTILFILAVWLSRHERSIFANQFVLVGLVCDYLSEKGVRYYFRHLCLGRKTAFRVSQMLVAILLIYCRCDFEL